MVDPLKKSAEPLPSAEIASSARPADCAPAENNDIAKLLQEEAPDVIAALPAEKKQKLIAVVEKSVAITEHHGPIPCPGDIAEYNKHIPNGADRIMKMAEDQSRHRMEMEKLVISSQQRQGERGQVFGLIIGVVGLSIGAFVAIKGHDWVGGGIAGTSVISLVYAFVTGKKSQRRDLDKKAQSLPKKE